MRSAVAAPIPLPAPVTKATHPSSRPMLGFLLFSYKICVAQSSHLQYIIGIVYNPGEPWVSTCSFQASYPMWADQRAVAGACGQNHAVTRGKIDISGCFGTVWEHEANGPT